MTKKKSTEIVNSKPKEKNKGGRPTLYTKELGLKFCKTLLGFNTIQKCCDSYDEFPKSESTIYEWLAEYPEFAEAYKKFNKTRAFKFAEQALEIVDDDSKDLIENPITKELKSNNAAVTRSALKSNFRFALAKKFNPEHFGDKSGEDTKQDPANTLANAIEKLADKLPT